MRTERQVKELQEKGEPVPPELLADVEKYRNMKAGEAIGGPAPAARGGGGGGTPMSGVAADGTLVFPPGVGDGPKGDPNSAEKVKARRMRAERKFRELTAASEAIPEDVAQTLYELGSDLAPNGTIWAALAGSAGDGAASDDGAAVVVAASADGKMVFPPGIGTGPKGDPNSYEKVRARRMRAERKAKESLAAGEAVPADVIATLQELGGEVPGAA